MTGLPDRITRNRQRLYPELQAGGFTKRDGTIAFYVRVNALLRPTDTILDFGAGRGRGAEDACAIRRDLLNLQGKVKKVVGVDVDDAVKENPTLDEWRVIAPDRPVPLPDASFDLILSDWVLEHIDNPSWFASEVYRLLRPGGWLCARTPNKWGLTGLGARLTPNRLHKNVLAKLTDNRLQQDVFPTRYRLNTIGSLRKWFPRQRWQHASYMENAEPPYVMRSLVAARLVQMYWRVAPTSLFTNLHVFLQRRA
jgi:SAM-dependent methyltransferase